MPKNNFKVSGTLANVIKLFLFALALPVVVAATENFLKSISHLPLLIRPPFMYGVISYVVLHLFVYRPKWLHDGGQAFISNAFRFNATAAKAARCVLPFSSIGIFIVLIFNSSIFKIFTEAVLLFLLGASVCMHVIFVAKELDGDDQNVLRPDYYFYLSLSYVGVLCLLVMLLSFIYDNISFSIFMKGVFDASAEIYSNFWNKLFVVDHG